MKLTMGAACSSLGRTIVLYATSLVLRGAKAKFLRRKPTGFIHVREMSGKFKFFQGQGIVREFYVVSGKNECFLKCQGNVREF